MCFLVCFFLFVLFITQAIELRISFLFLTHDVKSFHSYSICGEILTLIDSCEEGMSGCITVFSRAYLCCFVCFVLFFLFFWSHWAGQDGGMSGVGEGQKRRESVSAAKFWLTQRNQNNRTGPIVWQQHTLSLPPRDLQATKTNRPTPPSPGLSDTLNLPLFLHAPALPCQQNRRPPPPRPPHSLLMQRRSASQLTCSVHQLLTSPSIPFFS